jgi:hypothetical protein
MPRAPAPSWVGSDRALVEPALHDAGILGGRIFNGLSWRGFYRLLLNARRCRGELGPADLNLAARPFSRRRARDCSVGGRRCGRGGAGSGRGRILCRLAVSDEIVIAWSSGPRRHVGRQAAGPMRHMIRHVAGEWTARAERRAEPQQRPCGNEPFDNHRTRQAVGPARRMYRAPLTILSDRVAGL